MLKDVGENPSAEKVKDYVVKTLDGGVGIIYSRNFMAVVVCCMTHVSHFVFFPESLTVSFHKIVLQCGVCNMESIESLETDIDCVFFMLYHSL